MPHHPCHLQHPLCRSDGRELPAMPGNPLRQSNKIITVPRMLMEPPSRPPVSSYVDTIAETKRELGSLKKMVNGIQIAFAMAMIINVVINPIIKAYTLFLGDKTTHKISAAILTLNPSVTDELQASVCCLVIIVFFVLSKK